MSPRNTGWKFARLIFPPRIPEASRISPILGGPSRSSALTSTAFESASRENNAIPFDSGACEKNDKVVTTHPRWSSFFARKEASMIEERVRSPFGNACRSVRSFELPASPFRGLLIDPTRRSYGRRGSVRQIQQPGGSFGGKGRTGASAIPERFTLFARLLRLKA
ncbi:hypothetical protein KM043_001624 [Ampulex compressa]|nr:hypothetical protein KM043_001624 [Ampulex compressa]